MKAKRDDSTCQHDAEGFCFSCYQATREARYVALTVELERALVAGVTLLETWPGGLQTSWEWRATDDPKDAVTLACTLAPTPGVEHEVFIPGMTARYVADHLTNRSRGFGTTVTTL
jgi:hypothetical protein